MTLVAEKCDVQEGHKLGTPNIQALEVNNITGGPRISVAGVHRSPESTPTENLKLFHFPSMIVGCVGILIREDFNA